MAISDASLKKPQLLILAGGLVIEIAIIITFNKPPLYDEQYYLQNLALLHQHGLTTAYLMHHLGSAGPLYSILHYLLEPVTQLRMPYVRLVNMSLLLPIMYFLKLTLKLLHLSGSYALCVLAIPMTYTISGLALTEIPAISFFSAGIFFIIKISSGHTLQRSAILYSVTGGIFIGVAILGRQTYLLTLAALPILFWNKENHVRSGFLLLVTIVTSLALPGYVFYLWNGLVAPGDASIYEALGRQGVSFRPEFFFFCLAYFSIIFIIIAPGVFVVPNKRGKLFLLLIYIFLAAVNYHFDILRFLPLTSILIKIIPAQYVHFAELLGGAAMVLLAMYFIAALFMQLYKKVYPKELLFYSFAMLLIAVSCAKITWGFSSRYAAQALPMLIPIGAYFFRRNNNSIYRIMAGVILGLMSLASYLV